MTAHPAGMSYADYKAQMTRNRERLEAERLSLEAELAEAEGTP